MARKSRKKLPSNQIMELNNIVKTVMYLRLSVEDNKNNNENTSINTQRDIIKKYINDNLELTLVGEYVDNGSTGTNFKRNGFLKMIEDVEQRKIDCIVVKDLSRFGRNMIDTGYYIEKVFPMYNVRFIAINDNFDSQNKIENSFVLPVKNIINETYAKEISFKVRKEISSAMERGECISSSSPFGYNRVRENKINKYVVDKEKSKIVKKIFKLALDGLTPTEIKNRLNELRVPTPTAFKMKEGTLKKEKLVSNSWNRTIIKRILTNEVYIGNLVQGTRSVIDGKDIKLPKEKWITVKNNHEPIIDKNIFYEVREIIEKRALKAVKKNILKESISKIDFLDNKIFCGCCNNELNIIRRYEKYYYTCKNKKTNCLSSMISEEEIFLKINSLLNEKYKSNLMTTKKNVKVGNKELKKLKSSIETNNNYIKSLFESYLKKLLSKEDYLDKKNVFVKDNEENLIKISEIEKEQNSKNQKKEYSIEVVEEKIDKKSLSL